MVIISTSNIYLITARAFIKQDTAKTVMQQNITNPLDLFSESKSAGLR